MRKIFLTAGHRGAATGANKLIDEGAEAVILRNIIADNMSRLGVVPVTENDTDDLVAVVREINRTCTPVDVCVDLHFNAYNGSAHGTEVLRPACSTNTEIELAEDMLLAVTSTLGTKNRGVKREGAGQHRRLAMLSDVRCNSVVVEICFCDNSADVEKYRANRELLAATIAGNLVNHYCKH